MSYIIDTHCFLWSAFAPNKLSRAVNSIMLDTANDIFVSAISFWEISLKYSIGKLDLQGVDPSELIDVANQMGFSMISLGVHESASFFRLPIIGHRDPFDRMLVWQAINLNKILISKDRSLYEYKKYGLNVVW